MSLLERANRRKTAKIRLVSVPTQHRSIPVATNASRTSLIGSTVPWDDYFKVLKRNEALAKENAVLRNQLRYLKKESVHNTVAKTSLMLDNAVIDNALTTVTREFDSITKFIEDRRIKVVESLNSIAVGQQDNNEEQTVARLPMSPQRRESMRKNSILQFKQHFHLFSDLSTVLETSDFNRSSIHSITSATNVRFSVLNTVTECHENGMNGDRMEAGDKRSKSNRIYPIDADGDKENVGEVTYRSAIRDSIDVLRERIQNENKFSDLTSNSLDEAFTALSGKHFNSQNTQKESTPTSFTGSNENSDEATEALRCSNDVHSATNSLDEVESIDLKQSPTTVRSKRTTKSSKTTKVLKPRKASKVNKKKTIAKTKHTNENEKNNENEDPYDFSEPENEFGQLWTPKTADKVRKTRKAKNTDKKKENVGSDQNKESTKKNESKTCDNASVKQTRKMTLRKNINTT